MEKEQHIQETLIRNQQLMEEKKNKLLNDIKKHEENRNIIGKRNAYLRGHGSEPGAHRTDDARISSNRAKTRHFQAPSGKQHSPFDPSPKR